MTAMQRLLAAYRERRRAQTANCRHRAQPRVRGVGLGVSANQESPGRGQLVGAQGRRGEVFGKALLRAQQRSLNTVLSLVDLRQLEGFEK